MGNPLVSIIVITYNSAKFVLETLESAKAQTYQNIELIISDDGSQDETVELCEKWLAENKDRFIDSQIITVEQNTGIPANCNRGVKASKGEWIKLIAGDDLLVDSCISLFMSFIERNNEVKVVQCLVQFFGDGSEKPKIIPIELKRNIFKLSANHQLRAIYSYNFIASPGVLIQKDLIIRHNHFDEEFMSLEDFPMWLKILYGNDKFYLLDTVLVYYRRHENSQSMQTVSSNITPFTNNYINVKIRIYQKYAEFNKLLTTKEILKLRYFKFLNSTGWKRNKILDILNKIIYKL